MLIRYAVLKLLLVVPLLLGICLVVYLIGHLTPGDPITLMLGERANPDEIRALRAAYGLDRPFVEQFASFALGAARGDLGVSFRSGRPVSSEIASRLPATAELAVSSLVVGALFGLVCGTLAAARAGSALDRATIVVASLGSSAPVFWIGLLLIMTFSVGLGWLPVSGRGSAAHLVLPSVALGASVGSILARITRTSLLETLSQDYVRTARAKGLGEWSVVGRHALLNALIPVTTVIGLQLGGLLAGAVLTETVFAWPGIGRLLVQAVEQRDYPLVRGIVLFVGASFALINVALDVLFALLDPRIRYR